MQKQIMGPFNLKSQEGYILQPAKRNVLLQTDDLENST